MASGVGGGVCVGLLGRCPADELDDGIVREVQVVRELEIGDGSKRDDAGHVGYISGEAKREVSAGGVSEDDGRRWQVLARGGESGA